MRRLLIAAGGGGDAIATAMVHTALYGEDTPALVLTYAWERLVVDPVPGPRSPADFTGTERVGERLHLVTPRSAPVPPAGSHLPRLAAELKPVLGILDPYAGTIGMARQIAEAAAYCNADRVDIVDVGGDVVADGNEPTLRSPLGDALAVAACRSAGLPTVVHVAGPGLDSEVPEADLLPRLGDPAFMLTAEHTGCVDGVFDWHPSEASALLVAAARGVRGVCGTRDASAPVVLGPASAGVYRLSLDRVLGINRLARALDGVADLAGAEDACRLVCGFSEIALERERAARGLGGAVVAEGVPDAGALDERWGGGGGGGAGGGAPPPRGVGDRVRDDSADRRGVGAVARCAFAVAGAVGGAGCVAVVAGGRGSLTGFCGCSRSSPRPLRGAAPYLSSS